MTSQTRIMVTDDDPLTLLAVQRVLASAGYEVLTAASGVETLRLVQANPPDLLLLDVVLPDIEGTEVCRRIKADPQTAGTFIILLSGIRTRSDEQAQGMEGGADGYIARPIANRELLARVQAYLRIKTAELANKKYADHLEELVAERTQELQKAQEQLVRRETLAVLGQMAGSIGHELRNPLSVIANAVYVLKLLQPDADQKVKQYLEMIQQETDSTNKILHDLLNFTRINSLNRESIEIGELLRQTLKRYAAPPTVDVVVELDAGLPRVYADPQHLSQVFGNLIQNAYQAMPKGGKLLLSASIQESMIAIRIKDSGIGIQPENMGKLFEPLFTTKAKGIGLGLALCKKLTEANGGQIQVESVPGKGSSFSIILPIYHPVEA